MTGKTTHSSGRLLGYARVSTGDQTEESQVTALRAAGCDRIFREIASGGDRSRPVLRDLVNTAGKGDTVLVVRIDRLGRSLSHLLEVIETLRDKGVQFRSLKDPIDTSSPQGLFTLQVLGAAAEFERSLIKERTRAGLIQARSEGRVGGNPGLVKGDPVALRRIRMGREEAAFEKLTQTAEQWVPDVRRLRPDMPWEDLTRMINARLRDGDQLWTKDRLVRAAKRYVREGLLDARVLDRAPRKPGSDRLLVIVAGILGTGTVTLAEAAERLMAMREPTPRGQSRWSVSSVAMLADRARRHGLLDAPTPQQHKGSDNG